VACDIGTGEFLYGSRAAAVEFLAICERELPAFLPHDKQRMEEIKKNLARARADVGALNILVEEEGAVVLIDGRNVGRAPLNTIYVEPGAHRVEVVLDGYPRREALVSVEKGEERAVAIPRAKIEPNVPKGPVRQDPVSMPAPQPDRPKLAVAMAGGAVAIIGIGIGVGFTVAANEAASDRDANWAEMRWRLDLDCNPGDPRPACSDYLNVEQASRDHTSVATAAFISASVVAAATIAYVAFPRTFSKPTIRTSGSALTVYQW
jgi:hypothetical protein